MLTRNDDATPIKNNPIKNANTRTNHKNISYKSPQTAPKISFIVTPMMVV